MADLNENDKLAALYNPSASAGLGKSRHKDKFCANERRPRWIPDQECEALRDVIMGYIDDDDIEDPEQSGQPSNRQSKEIAALCKGHSAEAIPIAKGQRKDYVWVAQAQSRRNDVRKMYTWNVDRMLPQGKYKDDDDNRCDICGISCTEVLYEFRCYRRSKRILGENLREHGARRLHPFVSYISLECGRGLLGVQAKASQFLEHLTDLISSDNAVERLQELWRSATDVQKRQIESKLRYLAKTELGESERIAEFKRAERVYGELVPKGEDVFRVLSRALAPTISARELAAATILKAEALGKLPEEGYLAEVASRFRERQPLPAVPSPHRRSDVVQVLQLLTELWPLRLELNDLLANRMDFEPTAKVKNVAAVKLVYTCMELHALVKFKVETQSCKLLKTLLKEYAPPEHLSEKRAPAKSDDCKIEVPEGSPVEFDLMRNALESIRWPPCLSRKNVMPEGALFISAFPLGLVLNYCRGLMCSQTLTKWPNLASLLSRFIHQESPEFPYTTIQLNRDYATRMHVDANNLGPSMIIALGDYEGGELWIMDEHGDVELEVKDKLRGYSNLPVGSKVCGRTVDIRNKWVTFDGTVPHATLPFKGRRLSLVYFTRNKYLTMLPGVKEKLEAAGFQLPDEGYQDKVQSRKASFSAVVAENGKRRKVVVQAPEPAQEEEVDEIDEEEQFDAALREEEEGACWRARDWARQFVDRIGLGWSSTSPCNRPLGLSTCCTGFTPALALQELLPPGQVRVLAISDQHLPTLNFSKKNCLPEHAFRDLTAVTRGNGLCEAHHKQCEVVPASDEDLFVGGFCCGPFVHHDPQKTKHTCFDDDRAAPFKQQRLHIELRSPPIAILLVLDYEEVAGAQRMDALNFAMTGTDPRDKTKWGIGLLDKYWSEICEVDYSQYGVPQAQKTAVVILIRKDCGTKEAMEQAIRLLRETLGKVLSHSTVNELLFDDGDWRLGEIQRSWKRSQPNVDDAKASKAALKTMTASGVKSLGLNGELPYTKDLQAKFGVEFVEKKWFSHAADGQKQCLNVAYERARQSGVDISSLIVDLNPKQLLKDRTWRDDGYLPPLSYSAGGQPQYSFAKHRPISGQEQLLCRGYPLSRLQLKGFDDRELGQIAAASVPVPVIGAVLCSVLAVTDLKGRLLRLPAEHLTKILGDGLQPPRALSAAAIAEAATKQAAQPTNLGDAQFEGKAAALLNIVKHGAFGKLDKNAARNPTEQTANLLSKLELVDDESEARSFFEESMDPLRRKSPPDDETREWSIRLRKIRHATPDIDAVLRWVWDAADEFHAPLAEEIVKLGLNKVRQNLKDGKPVTRALKLQHEELEHSIKAADFAKIAGDFFEHVKALIFQESLQLKDPSAAIQMQTTESMKSYMDTVLAPLKSWPMQRTFIEHLGKELIATQKADLVSAFTEHEGFIHIANFLLSAPDRVDEDWPNAPGDLECLRHHYGKLCPRLLAGIHSALNRFADPHAQTAIKVMKRVEQQMIEETCTALQPLSAASKDAIKDFEHAHGGLGMRLQCTYRILEKVLHAIEQLDDAQESSEHWRHLEKSFSNEVSRISRRISELEDQWEQLTQAEAIILKSPMEQLQLRLKTALVKESREAELKALEEERRKAQEAKEREDLKAAQESQRIASCFHQAEPLERAVLSKLEGDRLIDYSEPGIIALHGELKRLKQHLEQAPVLNVHFERTFKKAAAAARMCSEASERHLRSSTWLELQGFKNCVELLDAAGIVDRLPDLKSKGEELLRNTGLPHRVRQRLIAAAGHINDDFSPNETSAPPGWRREFSSSGLSYFASKERRDVTQWLWPASRDQRRPRSRLNADEPAAPPSHGVRADGTVPYMEIDDADVVFCHLCNHRNSNFGPHQSTASHHKAKQHWEKLVAALEDCRSALMQDTQLGSEEIVGLVPVWRAEILSRIKEVGPGSLPASVVSGIEAIFWHSIVLPLLPSVSSPTNMDAALGCMLELACAREPSPRTRMPKPGIDFPYFPSPSEAVEKITVDDSEDSIRRLTPFQLLGEGIARQPDGAYRCGYCDETVDDLVRHLHPHFKKNLSRHRKNRDSSREYVKSLRSQGCELEAGGVTVANNSYSCRVCSKSGEWWKLFEEEGGHLASKAHKGSLGSGAAPEGATEVARKAWEAIFETADRDFAEQEAAENTSTANESQKSQPVTEAPKPSVVEECAQTSTVSQPLPQPGEDFPVYTSQDDCFQDRGGQLYCTMCDMLVPNRDDHLSLETRMGKYHAKNAQHALEATQRLRADGWRLASEGITVKDHTFRCSCCDITGPWYNLFNDPPHIETKKHIKFRRGCLGDLQISSPEDPRKRQWDELWKQFEDGAPRTSGQKHAVEEFASDVTPQKKRPRTNAPPETVSSPSAGSCKSAAQAPAGAAGYPYNPTASDITSASTKAENKHVPPLPHKELVWAYFRKPHLYMGCHACSSWVAVIEFNHSTRTLKTDDGSCPHYDAAARAGFHKAMQDVLDGKW